MQRLEVCQLKPLGLFDFCRKKLSAMFKLCIRARAVDLQHHREQVVQLLVLHRTLLWKHLPFSNGVHPEVVF